MTIKKEEQYQNALDIVNDARFLLHKAVKHPKDVPQMVDSFNRCQEDLYTVLRFIVDIYNNGK